jgi:DNA-binding response OmpR family regulator
MHKILVVEDDRNLADTIREYLAGKLYQTTATADGNQGYALARSGTFDLILLDVMLPGRSGYVLVQQLRNSGVETPVLMISGKKSCEEIITGLQCGADGYLVKPFNLRELKARCDALLKRPAHSRNEQLSFLGVKLHPESYRVTRQGRPVPLRKKEFEILRYLYRHSERAISRDQLIDQLWTDEDDTQISTIDVHISNIRQKLNRGFKEKLDLIETVHGVGFKIRAEV